MNRFVFSSLRALPAVLAVTLQNAAAQAAGTPEEDIRPPRGKIDIPVPETVPWTPWLAAGVILLALAALFTILHRRRKPRGPAPLERALGELSAIDRERNHLPAGPLADQSAAAVRQFIAGHFGIAAPKRTTEEFLRALARREIPRLEEHRDRLQAFLNACDLAKFAAADFDAAERLKLLGAAIDFVRAAGNAPPGAPAVTLSPPA